RCDVFFSLILLLPSSTLFPYTTLFRSSGDFLALDRGLPPVERGELLCVFSAGAYGFSMSSNYNTRPRPAEVLVDGAAARVIRRRDRKSTRLNSSHLVISYAVFCLKKKN